MDKVSLYGLEKDGSIKVWSIFTTSNTDGTASVTVQHGKEGGKIQEKTTAIPVGKQNRTAYEQAVNEANGKIKKNVDKGYRYSKAELQNLPTLAMLAGDYRKISHRIDYSLGVDTSFKMDGVRCIAKCTAIGVVTLESRTGQPYFLPHITAELAWYMNEGEEWDGEIYKHGYMLQDITSAVKRTDTQKEIDICQHKVDTAVGDEAIQEAYSALGSAKSIHKLRPQLEFIMFDVISDAPWFTRKEDLKIASMRMRLNQYVRVLEYVTVYSEEEMKEQHRAAVMAGYEGIMLRNKCGYYESGKRSADLQKYKEFMDSEFYIYDVVADKDGLGVFVVMNTFNTNFFTVIMGTHAERLYQLNHKDEFIGKLLTVKYQSLYKGTLIPQFPCGLNIRDYE